MSMCTREDWELPPCDDCWREERIRIAAHKTLGEDRLCDECWDRAPSCWGCGTKDIKKDETTCEECKLSEEEEKEQTAIFLLDNSAICRYIDGE